MSTRCYSSLRHDPTEGLFPQPKIYSFLLSHDHDIHSAFSFLIVRFRHEYRLERKLLNELSVDPESFPIDNEDLSNIVATTSSCQPSSRHRISRVVVLHKDRLETFFNPDQAFSLPKEPVSGESFDNDSFWSGSLTWY